MTDREIQLLEAQVNCGGLQFKTAREAARSALDRYMELEASKNTGLKIGNVRFDSVTGGLKPSNLVIVGGETNSGKTTFTMNMVNHVVRRGHGVILFSLEMDSDEVMDLLYAMGAEIDRNKFNHANFGPEDGPKLQQAMMELQGVPLYIFDEPNMSLETIRSSVLLLTAQYQIDLIVVDYLQLVNTSGYKDNREQQVASISRGMKALAKETKLPVIALSQLNEEGKVRESRGIAHDANIVMLLSGKAPNITLDVVKGRSIPKGQYSFKFESDYAKFTETGCDEFIARRLPRDEPYHSSNGTNGHLPDPYRGKARAVAE